MAKRRSAFGILIVFTLIATGIFVAFLLLSLLFSPGQSWQRLAGAPIAIVKIEGGIFDSEETLKKLHDYAEDDSIKAIILRINSPGGAVSPSQEIFKQVLKVREKGKKVIVSMGTVAASGGYYIAVAGDKIIASPGTITGSIGVIMQSFGLHDLMKTLQIEPRTIKTGDYKAVGNPFEKMTDKEKEFLKELAYNLYHQFLNDVAEQRQIPQEQVKELAQGKIYSGEQAKKLKLIDDLGNLYDAIELAKSEAGLPKDAKVIWPRKPSFLEKLLSEDSMASTFQSIYFKLGARHLPVWFFDQANHMFIH